MMKNFGKYFIVSLLLLLAYFIIPSPALAQESGFTCNNFSVSSVTNTLFHFTANCNNSEETSVNLVILDSDGFATDMGVLVSIPASGNLDVQVAADPTFATGTYYGVLIAPNNERLTDPISFELTQSDSPIDQGPSCCSLRTTDEDFATSVSDIIANEPECIVPPNSRACPSICSSWLVHSGGNPYWICAGSSSGHPALCADNGVPGVRSGIGCIPIENVSLTAQFILQWSLGVGGGISLFMLALGGIQFMGSRGDQERTKSAKNMITAALAGIVLIVLAVFVLQILFDQFLGLG